MSRLGLGPLTIGLASGAYQSVGGGETWSAPPPPAPGCSSSQYSISKLFMR